MKSCGPIDAHTMYHVNTSFMTPTAHGYRNTCDCGKLVVMPGHSATKEEKMPDYTDYAQIGLLDNIRNPAPTTYYLILMPNGDFVIPDGGNYARSNPKIFYTLEDAQTKVLELMIEANKIGVPDYKPKIVTKTVQQRITEKHTYDDDILQWIDENAKTLKGGD